MKYLRKWTLPTLVVFRHEPDEHPDHWGKSFFWYCHFCGHQYAYAELFDEETVRRPFQAISGVCPDCPSDRWSISGSIEGSITLGWNVPIEVAQYQLERELIFTEHPDHPHNKGVCE